MRNKVRAREYKIIEGIILSGFIFSILYTPVFQTVGMKIETFVFGFILSIGYMFFGFYLFGKPSSGHDFSFSVLAGVVYSFGVMSLMFNSLAYAISLIFSVISLVVLIGLLISLLVLRRMGKMRRSYLKFHLLRSIVLLVLNVFFLIY